MELYLQICAGGLLALVMILCLGEVSGHWAGLLAVVVCCTGSLAALRYLQPVLDLIRQLQDLGGLNGNVLTILLKACGIGILTQIVERICADCGNSSLGKTFQFLGSAVILWLSIPLFTMLMELLQNVLGEL